MKSSLTELDWLLKRHDWRLVQLAFEYSKFWKRPLFCWWLSGDAALEGTTLTVCFWRAVIDLERVPGPVTQFFRKNKA